MSGERYTLDANILVYAMDPQAAQKNVIAKQLWASARTKNCVLTTQALAEAYNAVTRKQLAYRDDAYRLLSALSSSVLVVSADNDLTDAMAAHSARPIHFWDAMLWATASRHGCTTILTEDAQDRSVVNGVRYLNPFTASQAELAAYLPTSP